jgi:hypothetical protein
MTPNATGKLLGYSDITVSDLDSTAELISKNLRVDQKVDALKLVDYVRRRYDLREDLVQTALLYMLDRGLAFSDSGSRISKKPPELTPLTL